MRSSGLAARWRTRYSSNVPAVGIGVVDRDVERRDVDALVELLPLDGRPAGTDRDPLVSSRCLEPGRTVEPVPSGGTVVALALCSPAASTSAPDEHAATSTPRRGGGRRRMAAGEARATWIRRATWPLSVRGGRTRFVLRSLTPCAWDRTPDARATPTPSKGAGSRRGTARRVWQFARPYRGTITVFLAAILVAAFLALVPPFVVREILDTAIPDGDRRLIIWLAAVAVARRARATPRSRSSSAGAARASAKV